MLKAHESISKSCEHAGLETKQQQTSAQRQLEETVHYTCTVCSVN